MLTVTITYVLGAPHLIMYGGAWKGSHAEQNVLNAIELGYRAFDTANVYAASYNETAMGVALERARSVGLHRKELFIQTKFTPGIAGNANSECPDGPWDPKTCMFDKDADLATQVRQSAQTSLDHLRVEQLDALIIHESRQPWDELVTIWRTLEDLYTEGKTASIGLSHIHDAATFRRLLDIAKIKPSFVQHPIFASNGWDRTIRQICREHGIVFQAYSLNHADNDFVYETATVQRIARRLNCTPRQVVVAMTKRLGLLPLVGPQDPIKMAHAIAAARYLPALLTEAEVDMLENIASVEGASLDGRAKVRGSEDGATGTLLGDDAKVQLVVTNQLQHDIYMAWQTKDHSRARVQKGMHVQPSRIAAGDSSTINTFHRHGFYFWDAVEGEVAPLYREKEDKRWVRRVRVNGFQENNAVVIDESFKVVVVNLGMDGREVWFVGSDSENDGQKQVLQGVVGSGGSLSIDMFDGHILELRGAAGLSKRVTVRRRDGDPQLLSVGKISDMKQDHPHGEL